MPEDRPDVCVIGAGALGLATAHFLQQGGCRVTVLEADHVASGSSGLSVGIIETQYIEPLDIALRVDGMRFFEQLEADHGLDVIRNGYLRLVRDEGSLEAARSSVEIQRELGVDAELLDRDAVQKLVPQMRTDDVVAGLYGPNDGFIDGHLYCELMAQLLLGRGVVLRVRQKVTGLSERGERLCVQTASGEAVECDFVVNAAGAWASRVAELLGTSIRIEPQRHQAIVADLGVAPGYVVPSVMDYIPHSGEIGLYFRHEREGQLVVGLHTEEVQESTVDPDNYGRGVDHEFMELVAGKLSSRLPGFPEARLGGGWAGLYPVSPDGVPQIGPCGENPRVIAAGGAGGSGIQLSPALGRIAAEWILEGGPSRIEGAAAMRPDRLSRGGVA